MKHAPPMLEKLVERLRDGDQAQLRRTLTQDTQEETVNAHELTHELGTTPYIRNSRMS